MKRILVAVVLCMTATPLFAADVGVSITIGDPNFYGQINFGNTSRPDVIYRDAVVIERPRRHVVVEPIYLRVRPGHEKHWRRHCHEYRACGRPVYFIRDTWYQKRYASHYHHRHEHQMKHRRAERRAERREERREERRYERRADRREARRDERRDERRYDRRDNDRDWHYRK